MKRKQRNLANPDQPELFGLVFKPFVHPFRLRAGDVLFLENRLCRVVRVTECAAVLIMNQPTRQFSTRFDKPVRFQPKPKIVRIYSNAEIPILNRKNA